MKQQARPPAPGAKSQNSQLIARQRGNSLLAGSNRELRRSLPLEHAIRLQVLPLSPVVLRGKRYVSIATPRKLSQDELQALRFCFASELYVVPSQPELFPDVIYRAYQGDFIETKKQVCSLFYEIESVGRVVEAAAQDSRTEHAIERLLRYLLQFAWSNEASDLQLIPQREGLILRLHTRGSYQSYTLPGIGDATKQRLTNYVISLLKIPYQLPDRPIDGKFESVLGAKSEVVRVHIFPTVFGHKIVCRLPLVEEIPELEELGLPTRIAASLEQATKLQHGLLLLVGSTGSGKTTTLYALVQRLAELGKNVVTLEDPVERIIAGVSQTSLEHDHALDYCAATKALLRQRPDVIMLSEIRDRQTAQIAVEAALSGHLVLASIHCNSVADLALRFRSLGVSSELFSGALQLALYQQLLESLCEECAVIDLTASRELGFTVRRAAGCPSCSGTGYSGFCLAAEALLLSHGAPTHLSLESSLEELVRAGKLDVRSTHRFMQAHGVST